MLITIVVLENTLGNYVWDDLPARASYIHWLVEPQCRNKYYTILITDISPEWNRHLSDGLGSKCFLSISEGERNCSKSLCCTLTSFTLMAKQMEVPAPPCTEEWACSLSVVCMSLIRCPSSRVQVTENETEAEISHWPKLPWWTGTENNIFKQEGI